MCLSSPRPMATQKSLDHKAQTSKFGEHPMHAGAAFHLDRDPQLYRGAKATPERRSGHQALVAFARCWQPQWPARDLARRGTLFDDEIRVASDYTGGQPSLAGPHELVH
jgi:hypothetical protein